MNKTLIKLMLVAGVAASGVSAAQAQTTSYGPDVNLPMCAAVYGTIANYAKNPDTKASLKAKAMAIMKVALNYNPQAADNAIALMKRNVARVDRNDPEIVDEIKGAQNFCASYVAKYGA